MLLHLSQVCQSVRQIATILPPLQILHHFGSRMSELLEDLGMSDILVVS